MDDFTLALADVCSGYEALRPPNRVSVSEGIAQTLYIKRPGGAAGYWSPAETQYMVEPADMLGSRRHGAVCFVGPAQTGKALDVDTPVPTPAGWTRMGDLVAGDVVFGDEGAPCKVLAAHAVQFGRPCYRVEFSDGTSIVADDEHLWTVERFYWRAPNWREATLTTAQMRDEGVVYAGNRQRFHIRNADPLALPALALPVDPYVLGAWLGNGTARTDVLSFWDRDLPHYVEAFRHGGQHVEASKDGPNTVWMRAPDLAPLLQGLGVLGNKHIPPQYLRASSAQRLALLQGLMDTDGYPGTEGKSAVEFSTVIDRLKDEFLELARTLGLRPVAVRKETTWTHAGERRYGTAWRVTFSAYPGLPIFRLQRKADAFQPAEKDVRIRGIVAIEPVPSRPVRCILVDNPRHLFLAGAGMVPTHNTVALVDGWLAHAVANDQGDFLCVQMTQDKAREYSKQRVQRMLRNSPKLAALKGPSGKDATIHDFLFKHGMWAKIAWPTVTNLSSTSYRYVAITDYDRIADDIDGEGDAFTLGRKRTTTFLSRGMIAVESSPGRPVTDPGWRPATPHEAPPVNGVLGIYNRGDRRRWYWQCPDCGEWHEPAPGVAVFGLPSTEELLTDIRHINIDKMARQYARIPCPHCSVEIGPEHKDTMNRGGVWLPDGVKIDAQRRITGEARTSDIASYWLGGAAATYISWEMLLRKHLQALLEFALTGNELAWQTTVNTDQGAPYMARALAAAQAAADPADRKDAALQRFICPPWTRFLIATVDVQGGIGARFVVQVHAIGPYQTQTPIDRYNITESMREGVGGKAPVDPASHAEDWDCITERVLRSTYRIEGRDDELRVHLVVVDTGGEGRKGKKKENVTEKAYEWFRRIRREGERKRVALVKGTGRPADWYVRETKVGGKANEGDVPLYLLNSNLLMDAVDASAKRESGPGALLFPAWLTPAWFEEFSAEVRNADGTWTQIRARNESADLCKYVRAGCMILKVDKWKDWDRVPAWALPLDQGNSGLISSDARREMRDNERIATTPVVEARPERKTYQRRSAASPYLG